MKSSILIALLFSTVILLGQQHLLDDEFNNPCSMSDWKNITQEEGWDAEHLEAWDVSETYPGELMMMPWTSSWYANHRGTLLFKEITGDFVFTIEVTATNRAGQNIPPSSQFSLAGMMMRTPKDTVGGWRPGEENYVFLSNGSAGNTNRFQFEVKTTVNSNSQLMYINIDVNNVLIRMARIGGAIIILYQIPGNDWVVHQRYRRDDFPETVQIGFVTYTDYWTVDEVGHIIANNTVLNDSYSEAYDWNPDLIGRFNFARFNDIEVPGAYAGLDLTDPGQVNDGALLSFLDYASVPHDGYSGKQWLGIQSDNWQDPANWLDGILPVVGDEIRIPNCNCSQVFPPRIVSGTHSYNSLILEEGATLFIDSGVTLNIDLSGMDARILNNGTIDLSGIMNISNTTGKEIINMDQIIVRDGGEVNVQM